MFSQEHKDLCTKYQSLAREYNSKRNELKNSKRYSLRQFQRTEEQKEQLRERMCEILDILPNNINMDLWSWSLDISMDEYRTYCLINLKGLINQN